MWLDIVLVNQFYFSKWFLREWIIYVLFYEFLLPYQIITIVIVHWLIFSKCFYCSKLFILKLCICSSLGAILIGIMLRYSCSKLSLFEILWFLLANYSYCYCAYVIGSYIIVPLANYFLLKLCIGIVLGNFSYFSKSFQLNCA